LTEHITGSGVQVAAQFFDFLVNVLLQAECLVTVAGNGVRVTTEKLGELCITQIRHPKQIVEDNTNQTQRRNNRMTRKSSASLVRVWCRQQRARRQTEARLWRDCGPEGIQKPPPHWLWSGRENTVDVGLARG